MPLFLRSAVLALAVAVGARSADHEFEPLPLQPIPVRVCESGETTIPLSGGESSRDYLLVVGSLVRTGSPAPVSADLRRLAPGAIPPPIAVESSEPPEWWRWRVRRDRSVMQRARERVVAAPPRWSTAKFAEQKTFHLFAGEDDLLDPKRYVAAHARLARVGRHCVVYVDVDAPAARELVDEVVRVFDDRVYPSARATFGEHRDVDRNGKLTILLTSWLDRLSGGKVSLSGFVRGADFYRDVEAPFSNQCDMLYLNASLEPGPHLTTIIAHEYTHAITFCEHVFGEYLPGGQGRDDEAWLSEAVAHVAENLHGDGWSNLDYRISTYLNAPHQYRLVVPDYFHAGLWRCHGSRGAAYLFLRYCVDRCGEGVLGELSRSNLAGVENIETAAQAAFAELFRGWTTATSVASVVGPAPGNRSPLLGRLERRLLAGVRPIEVGGPHGDSHDLGAPVEFEIAPTGWACLRIHAPAGPPAVVTVRSPNPELQLTLVRLPDGLARARMDAAPVDRGGKLRIRLASDRPVRWDSISWELYRLPLVGCEERERSADVVDARRLLRPVDGVEGAYESTPIDVSSRGGGPVAFKALGRDEQGRPVAAWAVVELDGALR
jgi:hypothetical protein